MFKFGKVEIYIYEKLEREKFYFVFFDLDDVFFEFVGELVSMSEEVGVDVIMVGGLIGVEGEVFDSVVRVIKESLNFFVILFLGLYGGISKYVDVIFFMSFFNLWNLFFIMGV